MPQPESRYVERPRRRREDADLSARVSVIEAIQEGHERLFNVMADSLQSLTKIESENAIARQRSEEHARQLEAITQEMPSFKIVRLLVFTAAIAILGSALSFGWLVMKSAAELRLEKVKDIKHHANQ